MKLCGTVVRGKGRGADLGFPTANIRVEDKQETPNPGVYAGTTVVNNTRYLTAIHIGPVPTFSEYTPTVEAHLLDFSGDLYDQTLCLEITQKLRDVEKFDTIEELKEAMKSDCDSVRTLLSLNS